MTLFVMLQSFMVFFRFSLCFIALPADFEMFLFYYLFSVDGQQTMEQDLKLQKLLNEAQVWILQAYPKPFYE